MAKTALSQWNTEQGTSPAYTQSVPTLAQKCAEVKMLGGHTALVEQQLVSALVTKISVTDADNQVVYEKAIPASVQALPGYGWSAGTYYNYTDFAQKKYHQVIGTRAHQSGDEDDPTVITDGTNTYYKLTTEVVTDISAALTDYCLLEITDATTVTFTNAAGLSVPNTINYAITQRTNGAVFDDNISSADDLALIQQTVSVQPATPKTNIIEIPGADGYIDLTEALGVGVKYNARQITWTFAIYPNASWYDKQSAVSNAINGLSCRITLDCTRSIICTFFKWAAAEGYIQKNPCSTVKPIKYTRNDRGYLTEIELETIRQSCGNPRDKAIIEMLYSTGCRVSELIRLKYDDVDMEKKEVHLFGKGSKWRTSYINARAEIALKEYLETRTDDCQYIFVSGRVPHQQLTKAAIERMIRELGNKVNLGRRLFPHLFRNSMATHGLQRGLDITEVQRILGHKNIDTTLIYAHVAEDSVKRGHKRCIV